MNDDRGAGLHDAPGDPGADATGRPDYQRDASAEVQDLRDGRRQLRLPRQRVRAGGGDQALRHPVVDVAEAVEAPSLLELYSASYKEPR